MRILANMLLAVAVVGCHPKASEHPKPAEAAAPNKFLDRTMGRPSICELHNRPMKREALSFHGYGLAGAPFEKTHYPHGGQPIDSGCLGLAEPARGFDWVCPVCKRNWERAGKPLR